MSYGPPHNGLTVHDSGYRQQRRILRTHVLVRDIQEQRRRRIVAHQGNDVDQTLPAKLLLGSREGVGTDLMPPERLTTEPPDDYALLRHLRDWPAMLPDSDDFLLQVGLLSSRFCLLY